MKSNVPWSVKGIDPEARVVAKEAARKAGMTLGEWMTSMIHEVGQDNAPLSASPEQAASTRTTGVSPEQLRAVVDSLNRLNERLKTTEDNLKRTEEKSRDALGGLNQGLEAVFDRVKKVEAARAEVQAAVAQSSSSSTPEGRERLASLKSLEGALTQMIDQFEHQRVDTLARVEQNENAVSALNQRVDVLDQRITAGFHEVHDALDTVGQQLDHTERTAKSVMLEAQSAANSTDAEFVERTGKKLQLLGNEIKRSGDQISEVEKMVASLSAKIEAAESRSAEGIADVAKDLTTLRDEIDSAEVMTSASNPTLQAAAASAEETVASLQKSYEQMIARMEGRIVLDDEAEATDDDAAGNLDATADDAGADDSATLMEASLETDVAPRPAMSPQDAMRAAMSTLHPGDDPRSDEPVPKLADTLKPAAEADPDAEFDAVFGDVETPATDASSDDGSSDTEDDAPTKPLTPREKIIAAAKLRKQRVEQERAAEEAAADAPPMAAAEPDVGPVADNRPGVEDGQNRKLGLPLIALLGLCVVGAVGAGAWFFRGNDQSADTNIPPVTGPATTNAPETSMTPPAISQPSPVDTTPDAKALYQEAVVLADGGNPSAAFPIMREAAVYGNVPAQYRLGEMYFSGNGTAQDLREAKRWFESAALSGNAVAMHRLGSLAINPDAGAAQYDQAVDWFARAANYGVVDSMYNLGLLYDPSADYLPTDMRNAERSYRYFMLAARQGDPEAENDAALVATGLDADTVATINNEVAQWTPLPIDPRVNDGLNVVN